MNADQIARVIADHSEPGKTFSANDVWEWIGHDAVLAHPNGTMGIGFRKAQAAGTIIGTDKFIPSRHPARKGGIVRVWRWVEQGDCELDCLVECQGPCGI